MYGVAKIPAAPTIHWSCVSIADFLMNERCVSSAFYNLEMATLKLTTSNLKNSIKTHFRNKFG